MVSAACAPSGSGAGEQGTQLDGSPAAETGAPLPGDPTAVPTIDPAAPTIMITGVVREVASDSRVITLTEPVHGLGEVVVIDETRILGADGGAGTVQDIGPEAVIQVSGAADGRGGVLALEIRIVSAPGG